MRKIIAIGKHLAVSRTDKKFLLDKQLWQVTLGVRFSGEKVGTLRRVSSEGGNVALFANRDLARQERSWVQQALAFGKDVYIIDESNGFVKINSRDFNVKFKPPAVLSLYGRKK